MVIYFTKERELHMSKKQKIVKMVWYYSFILEIFFLFQNIFAMINGVGFFFSVNYGFDALVINILIVWGFLFWWAWAPIVLFQIIYAIYLIKHKECKELNINNKSIYIPLAIVSLIFLILIIILTFLT